MSLFLRCCLALLGFACLSNFSLPPVPVAPAPEEYAETVSEEYVETVSESSTDKTPWASRPEDLQVSLSVIHAPDSADDVIRCWVQEKSNHEYSQRLEEELQQPIPSDLDATQAAAKKQDRAWKVQVVEAWKQCKRHPDTRLTEEQFERLLGMKDVWVRALLYAYFPDHCPTDWVKALYQDIRSLKQPPQRFTKLIADLDDDDFRVRQKASNALTETGLTYAWHLWAIPKDKLSPEAAKRLTAIQDRLGDPVIPRRLKSLLSHVSWDEAPHCQELFKLLKSDEVPDMIRAAAQAKAAQREAFEKQFQNYRKETP